MNSKTISLAALAFICVITFACDGRQSNGAEAMRSHSTHDFALTLQPIEPRIPVGATPKFRLTLTNISDHTCHILNIEHRVDLQHTYYELTVTKDGKAVNVGAMISDPGPVSDEDWLPIAHGGVKTFTLVDFPTLYNRLPPGTYEACVRFWRDPHQDYTTAYQSETTEFTVTK